MIIFIKPGLSGMFSYYSEYSLSQTECFKRPFHKLLSYEYPQTCTLKKKTTLACIKGYKLCNTSIQVTEKSK